MWTPLDSVPAGGLTVRSRPWRHWLHRPLQWLVPHLHSGLAYVSAGRFEEAVGEFRRIVDHRSIVLVDPLDAMARLQLARTLALSADMANAKRAYDDLFTLWKNADPDIPVMREAQAEYPPSLTL
jgi:hypothetical protein